MSKLFININFHDDVYIWNYTYHFGILVRSGSIGA